MFRRFDNTTTTMGAEKVFDTIELLESVLLKLPFNDIAFTAPLVSKQWKAVSSFFSPFRGSVFTGSMPPRLPLRWIVRLRHAGNMIFTLRRDLLCGYIVL